MTKEIHRKRGEKGPLVVNVLPEANRSVIEKPRFEIIFTSIYGNNSGDRG